mmetsp:Transcript_43338/g.139698  ORF Transcript_43338/g.139698 Transcript_43338/m.139698 type:complete len:284 (+) Transcript_43338:117-968(+)
MLLHLWLGCAHAALLVRLRRRRRLQAERGRQGCGDAGPHRCEQGDGRSAAQLWRRNRRRRARTRPCAGGGASARSVGRVGCRLRRDGVRRRVRPHCARGERRRRRGCNQPPRIGRDWTRHLSRRPAARRGGARRRGPASRRASRQRRAPRRCARGGLPPRRRRGRRSACPRPAQQARRQRARRAGRAEVPQGSALQPEDRGGARRQPGRPRAAPAVRLPARGGRRLRRARGGGGCRHGGSRGVRCAAGPGGGVGDARRGGPLRRARLLRSGRRSSREARRPRR